METIEIKTLIDITNSGITRPQGDKDFESNQYKNWTTLLQCIGLRCIINYENDPITESVDIKDLKFGSKYKGKHTVWTFRFNTDRDGVYYDGNNNIGLLLQDLHQVPVIKKLSETINIPIAAFDLLDPSWKNTTVVFIDIQETE